MFHTVKIKRILESLKPYAILIILSVVAVAWAQAPRLVDHFRVDEDFRSFYWMNKFQAPELFSNDELEGHKYIDIHLPWGDLPVSFSSPGYSLLFYAASFVIAPVQLAKLLPFILGAVSVVCLFNYGRAVQDFATGVTLATGFLFVNLISPTSISVIPGFQRSFACPLTIVLLWYLHQENLTAVVVTVLVSALIYPPTFLMVTAAWGLYALDWNKITQLKLPIVKSELVLLMVAFLLGGFILAPIVLTQLTEAVGSTVSAGPVWQNPQYRAGGRYPLFYLFPFIGPGGFVSKGTNAIHLIILLFIGVLILLSRGPNEIRLPKEVKSMLWASLGLFLLAWVAALATNSFLLYKPSRYSRVGLFLFLLIYVLLNVRDGVEDAVSLIQRNRRKLVWLIGGVEIVILVLILLYPSSYMQLMGINMKWLLALAGLLLAILGTLSFRRSSMPVSPTRLRQTTLGRLLIGIIVIFALIGWGAYARAISERTTLDPSTDERKLLAFLGTLPQDVLLAGTPCALDNVPLFAKRQILFSCEQMSQDNDLMREALDAYYAEDTQAILSFCQAHEIDYLIIDHRTYAQEYLDEGRVFFEPYNQELFPRIRARDTFALAHVSDGAKVFQSGNFFVVPCTRSALEK